MWWKKRRNDDDDDDGDEMIDMQVGCNLKALAGAR